MVRLMIDGDLLHTGQQLMRLELLGLKAVQKFTNMSSNTSCARCRLPALPAEAIREFQAVASGRTRAACMSLNTCVACSSSTSWSRLQTSQQFLSSAKTDGACEAHVAIHRGPCAPPDSTLHLLQAALSLTELDPDLHKRQVSDPEMQMHAVTQCGIWALLAELTQACLMCSMCPPADVASTTMDAPAARRDEGSVHLAICADAVCPQLSVQPEGGLGVCHRRTGCGQGAGSSEHACRCHVGSTSDPERRSELLQPDSNWDEQVQAQHERFFQASSPGLPPLCRPA